MVTLVVRAKPFEVPDERAILIAEELRRRASGKFGDVCGIDGARPLADAIELRLVGEREGPVVLDRFQSIALFHYLNVAGIPGDPLYLAVRAIRDNDH
jgi:hypothetical protein